MLKKQTLYFFCNKVAFQTTRTDLYRKGCSLNLGFYFNKVGFPGPTGTVFGMTDIITGNRVLSANIASP